MPVPAPRTTPGSTRTYGVALTVEVDRDSWKLTYGENPETDVPGYIVNAAMFLDPLLAALPKDVRGDGATVRLAHHALLTRPGAQRPKLALVLDVTLDPQAWRRAHGTGPALLIGPAVVMGLAALRPMREEVNATLEYLPGSSGGVIGDDTAAAGRFTPRTRP